MSLTLPAPGCSSSATHSVQEIYPPSPAIIAWTDAYGVEHRAAANPAVPSHALMDTAMRTVSGPSHVVDGEIEDGLLAALGGDRVLADAMLVADRDPSVVDFAVRPAEIRWPSAPSAPSFVLPMLQRLRSGRYRVVDTVANSRTSPSMVRSVCAEIGWRYTCFSRPSETIMANLRELALDRHWWVVEGWSVTLDALVTRCRLPHTIEDLCDAAVPYDPDRVRPLVNFAIWHEFLIADLEAPLSASTEVVSAVAAR